MEEKNSEYVDKIWLLGYNGAVNNGRGMLIRRMLGYSLKYSDK